MTGTAAVGAVTAPGHRSGRQQSFSGFGEPVVALDEACPGNGLGSIIIETDGVGQGSL